MIYPVKELASAPSLRTVPVRRFTWRPGQRHRPGLTPLLATGRMHGFESLAERRLLLALDFVGGLDEVLSQPFRLTFASTTGKKMDHTPDFLALMGRDGWLLDVRPGHLVKEQDAVKFAAAEQAAAAAGWRYSVVTGWLPQAITVVESLSARRRPMLDRLALQSELLDLVRERPRLFRDLVDATTVPAVTRVHAIHLLWHRRLAMDLAQPLGDGSWIYGVRSA
ncbi:TnsA-like heteromeric transposase endonuclease subunit [Streptomyces sp. YS-B37]|uniref:TnsA-like heteromeric transposase endonuclease subunit n=1 Tax=Streptomyces sp. YS-B37 TaxID=3407669 RepID=UPI003B501144